MYNYSAEFGLLGGPLYQAEIRGKISRTLQLREDLLTSNVFSFFKYADRQQFLKPYLEELIDIEITDKEANEAEFYFWPCFQDGTEPDLVIIVGKYYLLFEAKYFSAFDPGTQDREAQIDREIKNGKTVAADMEKEFRFVAITKDHYYKKDKFEGLLVNYLVNEKTPRYFKWTNWQAVTAFLLSRLKDPQTLNGQEQLFASDLCELLQTKRLRSFGEFLSLLPYRNKTNYYESIFLEVETVKFRGDFIGFVQSLSSLDSLKKPKEQLFYDNSRLYFRNLRPAKRIIDREAMFFRAGG